jgi:hypothetical protein
VAKVAFELRNEENGQTVVIIYRDGVLGVTDAGPFVLSRPPLGQFRVTNLYVDPATKKLTVEYDDGS